MIINGISTRSRAHLPRTRCNWINVRPAPLRRLTVGASNMSIEIKWKDCLTCLDMCREVKLWNKKMIVLLTSMVNSNRMGVNGHAFPEVPTPLANNIIRHYQLHDVSWVSKGRYKQIIHINVSERLRWVNSWLHWKPDIPLALLEIPHSIWALHVMTCTIDWSNTRCREPKLCWSFCIDRIMVRTSAWL